MGSKRCGACGALIVKSEGEFLSNLKDTTKVSEETIQKFTNYVENVYLDEGEGFDWNVLLPDAQEMGIPDKIAQEIVDKVRALIKKAELNISIYFDYNRASRGVANGSSILLIKVENTSKKNIERVEIIFYHPETNEIINFPQFTNVLRGKSKQHDIEIIYERIGQHAINEGQIKVIALSGAIEVYSIKQPIIMVAKNGNSIDSRSVVTNIETHGGGVIDASNNKTTIPDIELDSIWQKIALTRVNTRIESAPKSPPSPIFEKKTVSTNISEPNQTIAVANIQDQTNHLASSTNSTEIKTDANENEAKNSISHLTNYQEVSKSISKQLSDPKLISNTKSKAAETQSNDKLAETVTALNLSERIKLLEGDRDYQLPFDIVYKEPVELQNLIKYYLSELFLELEVIEKNSIKGNNNFLFLSRDIYFQFLFELSKVINDNKPIMSVSVCDHTTNDNKLISFKDSATVINETGIYVIESIKYELKLLSSFNWSEVKKSSFTLSENEGYISFGRPHRMPLPGMSYKLPEIDDLKVNSLLALEKSKLRLNQIFSLYDALSFKLIKEDAIKSAINIKENTDGLLVKDNILVAQATQLKSPQVKEFVDDEFSTAIRSFFSMLSFTSQYCDDQNLKKSIHIFGNHLEDGDLTHSLAIDLIRLLPQKQIICLNVDYINIEQNGQGKIFNWHGPASVICKEGIFHIQSNGNKLFFGNTSNQYLTWNHLFSNLDASLIIRHEVPDIWIGSKSNFYILGTYINFTNFLDKWVYFDEHVRKELFSRFNYFKKLAISYGNPK
jgi:hypothetical protein